MPFPHGRRTKAQARAVAEAIRLLPLDSWPATLTGGRKRASADAQRAVLEAIAEHTDRCGRAYVAVETIRRESGYAERTVVRALLALEEQRHLERTGLRRLPKSRPSLDHARRQQGPNLYRLGPVLRGRAGLFEDDWLPDPELALTGVAPLLPEAAEPTVAPLPEGGTVALLGGTPTDDHEVPASRRGVTEAGVAPPEQENQEQAGDEERSVPNGVEGTDARAPVAAKGQPVYCPNHDEETKVATVTSGLVYFACGCFAHEADWQGAGA
jgi:hypothetical protein